MHRPAIRMREHWKLIAILDDDSTLRIDDSSVTEGNTGTTPMPFNVTLDNSSAVTVTVHVQTSNGSAMAPGDYTAVSQNLTFAPGQTSKTVNVQVKGDATNETGSVGEGTLRLATAPPGRALLGRRFRDHER